MAIPVMDAVICSSVPLALSCPKDTITTSSTVWAISAEQVRGDQHGPPLGGQVAHEVAQPGDALGVEAVGRLVEDEHLGVADQRGGQLEALAHAQGEPTHLALGVTGQADQVEDLVGPLIVEAAGPSRHAQVGAGAPGRVEAGRLEHGAHDA